MSVHVPRPLCSLCNPALTFRPAQPLALVMHYQICDDHSLISHKHAYTIKKLLETSWQSLLPSPPSMLAF